MVKSARNVWSACTRGYRAVRDYLGGDGVLPWLANLALAFLIIKFVFFPLLGLVMGTQLPIVAVMSGSMDHRAADGLVCGTSVDASYSASLKDYGAVCGGWYADRGITQEQFSSFPFTNGFNKGDIIVLIGPNRGSIAVGDVIIFESRERYPIIHRVIAISVDPVTGETIYQTKGDHNADQISQYVVVDLLGRVSACEKDGAPVDCSVGTRATRTTPGSLAVIDETYVPQHTVIGHAVARIPWLGWIKVWFTDMLAWLTGGIAV